MLDARLRPIKERLLAPLARAVGGRVSPMGVTLAGAVLGLGSAFLVARAAYGAALVLWIGNRVMDGLDGTLARTHDAQTDFGGYVDIVLDFVVYAAIPIAFVIAAPTATTALAALLLLASFYVNAATWMYLAAILERRGAGAREHGELTTITMPDGLIGGSETIVLFTLYFISPSTVAVQFGVSACLVFVTAVQRVAWARRHL